MKDEMMKVKFTMHIPFDRPNKNGTVFTKEAVENAVNNIPINIPIICGDNKSKFGNKVIGTTTGDSHIVTWDFENQVCKMIVDGVVFRSGAEIVVNEIEDNKISDFRIVGVGLIT